MSPPPQKLPACERCRKSKIKCDTASPKCSACTKSKTSCIIVDLSTGERYSREQVHDMQRKLESLEARRNQGQQQSPLPEMSPSSPSIHRKSHYVGHGSGLDIFHRISSGTNTAEARAEVLEGLNLQSPRNELTVPGHQLPSPDLARQLIERYFTHSHLHHPLLTKQDTWETFNRVYDGGHASASKQDLYRIFMVSAISSITLFRKGQLHEHPCGFYNSGQRLMPHVDTVGSLDAIRNLLLIARFAMYYHIDCSIWDLTRLCMRQCIELGLHLPSPSRLPAMEEQSRRNLFWDCYVHDRYSSGILGRPYALSEEDIEVELPIEASETQILQSGCFDLRDVRIDAQSLPNEASIVRFVIRLRRITARIHIRFFSSRMASSLKFHTIASAGLVQADLDNFLAELQECRDSAPCVATPQSLYERSAWHDFVVEKDKLTLIRGAIANLPLSGMLPPQRLLRMCLKCATSVIECYISLFTAGHITWTRSYFQILFTSGLSIMFSMSLIKATLENHATDPMMNRASRALASCSELLSRFVSEMPDAGRFASVFEALSKQYILPDQPSNMQIWSEQSQIRAHNDSNLHNSYIMPSDPTSRAESMNLVSDQLTDLNHRNWSPSAFEVDLEHFEDWSLYPANSENFLGQMEAGVGQYAWGGQADIHNWQQYFSG